MCNTSKIQTSPVQYITSHRISCCSVAFIEIKFQQKLCFNNQVLMLFTETMFQDWPSNEEFPDSECAQPYMLSKCGQQ